MKNNTEDLELNCDEEEVFSNTSQNLLEDIKLPSVDCSGTLFTQLLDSWHPDPTQSLPLLMPSDVQYAPLEIPASHEISNIVGPYGFKVQFPNEAAGTRGNKGSSWIYSDKLDELFVKMNRDCPIQIHVDSPVPHFTFIRLTPYYRRADDWNEVPGRCLNHSTSAHESNKDHNAIQHLIRSYLPDSDHIIDKENGRASLLLPCNVMQSSSLMTYVVRFMCRTSCSGGMNRRPFCVLFELIINGSCHGRQVKNVHVSACPRRDCRTEESRQDQFQCKQLQNQQPQTNFDNQGLCRTQEQPSALVLDVKRACKRYSTSLDVSSEHEKHRKVYRIKVSDERIYKIMMDILPILERNMRKQDSRSTEEEN